jgi:hypothetical protein
VQWEANRRMLLLGLLTIVVVVLGLTVALRLARKQETEESAPASIPSDFVAPVSSGGYAWRSVDESQEQFKDRVARENAPPASSDKH